MIQLDTLKAPKQASILINEQLANGHRQLWRKGFRTKYKLLTEPGFIGPTEWLYTFADISEVLSRQHLNMMGEPLWAQLQAVGLLTEFTNKIEHNQVPATIPVYRGMPSIIVAGHKLDPCICNL